MLVAIHSFSGSGISGNFYARTWTAIISYPGNPDDLSENLQKSNSPTSLKNKKN